jgi:hypothetical protein
MEPLTSRRPITGNLAATLGEFSCHLQEKAGLSV